MFENFHHSLAQSSICDSSRSILCSYSSSSNLHQRRKKQIIKKNEKKIKHVVNYCIFYDY